MKAPVQTAGNPSETPAEISSEGKVPPIAKLVAMSDPELMSVFGLDSQLDQIKEGLRQLDSLTGPQRDKAEQRLEARLTPQIYSNDLQYMYEDIKREAKNDGKTEMAATSPSPSSVL